MKLFRIAITLLLWISALPALANSVSQAVDLTKLGNGKNSVYYFSSGGILYGFLEGQDFTSFALETSNGRSVPMTASGEAQTTTREPPGNGDKQCVEWLLRCWDSKQTQIAVCSARCTKRKKAESEEAIDAGPQTSVYLSISAPGKID